MSNDEFKRTHDIPTPLEVNCFYKNELTRGVEPISYHKWNEITKPAAVDDEASEDDFCLKCGNLYVWLYVKGGQNNFAIFSDNAGDLSGGNALALAIYKCIYWLCGRGVYIFKFAMKPRKCKRLFAPFADYVTVDEYNDKLGYTEKVYYLLTTRRNYATIEKMIRWLEDGGALNEFVSGNERTDAKSPNAQS